jgi:pyruvate/2-oxoglutarate/acetoin dehydrogenase E1 component
MTATTDLDSRHGSVLVSQALQQEMRADRRVVVFGEDVAALGGVFGATRQLQRTFGDERVFDTPISESAFVGMAVGAAQSGLRPVVELMFVDFLGVCFDQIANQMAKNHYMSGGRVRVPLVLRTAVGSIGSAAQHSQVLGATFAHIPGLRVVFPSDHADLQGMLVAAVRSDDPVVFLEHKRLLKARDHELAVRHAPAARGAVEPAALDGLRVLRPGRDLMLVAAGWMVQECAGAVDRLAAEGFDVGLVDLRVLAPLDREGLTGAVADAARVLVVDDDYLRYGVSGEVAISISERLARSRPEIRRHGLDVSQPASAVLERRVVPDAESIASAARTWLGE